MRSISAAEALDHYGSLFLKSFGDDHPATKATGASCEEEAPPSSAVLLEQGHDESSSEADSELNCSNNKDTPVFEFINSTVVRQRAKTRELQGERRQSHGRAVDAEAIATTEDEAIWTGSKAELASLQQQVQKYGADGLDKRSRRQYDEQQLRKLGLKAVKPQKMAAAIGKGLRQVNMRREHKATEAAIEAGHLSRRAVSKQQKKERVAPRKTNDGSLREDNGAFVGGVMRLKKIDKAGSLRRKGKNKR